jgi:hypothetical protein
MKKLAANEACKQVCCGFGKVLLLVLLGKFDTSALGLADEQAGTRNAAAVSNTVIMSAVCI